MMLCTNNKPDFKAAHFQIPHNSWGTVGVEEHDLSIKKNLLRFELFGRYVSKRLYLEDFMSCMADGCSLPRVPDFQISGSWITVSTEQLSTVRFANRKVDQVGF